MVFVTEKGHKDEVFMRFNNQYVQAGDAADQEGIMTQDQCEDWEHHVVEAIAMAKAKIGPKGNDMINKAIADAKNDNNKCHEEKKPTYITCIGVVLCPISIVMIVIGGLNLVNVDGDQVTNPPSTCKVEPRLPYHLLAGGIVLFMIVAMKPIVKVRRSRFTVSLVYK